MAKSLFAFATILLARIGSEAAVIGSWKRALDSPYAQKLRSCRDNWAELSSKDAENADALADCWHSLILAVAPRMTEPTGIPALGMKPLDPLSVEGSFPVGSEIVRGVTSNWVATGLTSGLTPENSRVVYDPRTKEATLTWRLPEEASVDCNYEIEMKLGSLFGQANEPGVKTGGTAKGKAGKVVFTMTFTFAPGKNKELRLKASKSSLEAATMKLHFTGNDPNDPITQTINTMTASNEVALSILNEMKPHLNAIMAKTLGALYHKGWQTLDRL